MYLSMYVCMHVCERAATLFAHKFYMRSLTFWIHELNSQALVTLVFYIENSYWAMRLDFELLLLRLGARTLKTKLKLQKYFQFRLRLLLLPAGWLADWPAGRMAGWQLACSEGSGVNEHARSANIQKQEANKQTNLPQSTTSCHCCCCCCCFC